MPDASRVPAVSPRLRERGRSQYDLTRKEEIRRLIALGLKHGTYTSLDARIEREVLMETTTEPYEIEFRIKNSDHDIIIAGVVAEAVRDSLIDQLGAHLGEIANASDLSNAAAFTSEQWLPLMWALRLASKALDALYWASGQNEAGEEPVEDLVDRAYGSD